MRNYVKSKIFTIFACGTRCEIGIDENINDLIYLGDF